jgi:uncharacterized membrane protein YphA (DoxX/SURF4 family)
MVAMVFAICAIITFLVAAYLAAIRWELSLRTGAETAGIKLSLDSVTSATILVGVMLVFNVVFAWYWANKIENIMDDAEDEIGAVAVRRAIRAGAPK